METNLKRVPGNINTVRFSLSGVITSVDKDGNEVIEFEESEFYSPKSTVPVTIPASKLTVYRDIDKDLLCIFRENSGISIDSVFWGDVFPEITVAADGDILFVVSVPADETQPVVLNMREVYNASH